MNKKMLWRGCVAAALITVAAGCYGYKEPAAATLGETYTERQHDASDETFKNMQMLTLREAQRIAIKNNPTYIAAFHAVEAARMRYLQAWGAYSPTVTASYSLQNGRSWRTRDNSVSTYDYSYTHDATKHTDQFVTQTGISANLLIFDGFARLFRLKAAKSDFNYYAHMEDDACRTMMQAVAYAYNTVLLAIENRRIAMEDRDFQKSSLQNTKYKFEAGAAPLSDVLNFEIYVNSADVSLIDADYQYEVAVYALAQLMGYPEGVLPSHVKFPEDYKAQFAQLPAVEVYLDAALANRPDLKAYRERLNVAKYQVYQAWGAYSPVVNGFVDFDFMTNRDKTYQHGDIVKQNDMSFSYGFVAEWTIFNGLIRTNKLREAKANRAAAEYQVAAQWFAVVSEVRTAYANYIQNVKKTKLYARIRSLSAKQRDLVDDEYRAGNAELTRLNEAQRDLVEAETYLASSYINVQNAMAQLDAVVGGNTADYYLAQDAAAKSYPGLGGVAGIQEKIDAAGKQQQSSPVQAPSIKRTLPDVPAAGNKPAAKPATKIESKPAAQSVAPVIPEKADAAPQKR
ncbi:MAG: TolC family protein [Lentisphaeria bacterium]|nr:TolC family protein [Lentisphaeria bacterium]